MLSGLAGLDSAAGQLYRMSEEPSTRVSGREARVIAVEPQDNLRYGYRVWIDESTAMPLKTQSHTVAGKVVEQLVFTELTLPAHIADSALQPAAATRQYRLLRHTAATGAAVNQTRRYHLGRRRAAARVSADRPLDADPGRRSEVGDSSGVQRRAGLGVRVRRAAGRRSRSDKSAIPAAALMTNMGSSTALSTEVDGHKVTTIGEVPPDCVRAITRSLRVGFAPGVAADGSSHR